MSFTIGVDLSEAEAAVYSGDDDFVPGQTYFYPAFGQPPRRPPSTASGRST
jgi:hypothetical protein